MNGDYHTLESLAKDIDILVVVAKGTGGVATELHMTLNIIVRIAKEIPAPKACTFSQNIKNFR